MGLENNRHLRIVDPAAGDEFIERRLDAIGRLKARIRKRTTFADQLNFAANVISALTDRSLDQSTRQFTSESLSAAAPSFVDDGNKSNELAIVFALACGDAIDVGAGTASEPQMKFLAHATKLGLAYLTPLSDEARENLRLELIGEATRKLNSSAEDERQRQKIGLVTTENQLAIINILARNAKWDREELDLLWWVVNDWSNIADQKVSSMPPDVACVISALETSCLFAGPAAQGHRNISTRHVADLDQSRSPKDFSAATVEARPWARQSLEEALPDIHAFPAIFPGLAIATQGEDAGNKLTEGLAAGAELQRVNWCRRLVDEIELLKRLGHTVSLAHTA